jgi:RHS repeat-associated protein
MHLIGLAYHDRASGTNLLLAAPKDCAPQILGTNRVLYADAFDDIHGDVIYSYTAAGVRQDVVLRERPGDPEREYGLSRASTHLLVISEVDESPTPVISERFWPDGPETLRDQSLGFNGMTMVPGSAFTLGHRHKIPVAKQFETLSGRHFVVERVRYESIREQVELLPPPGLLTTNTPAGTGTNASVLRSMRWYAQGTLPPSRGSRADSSKGNEKWAKVNHGPGFVLDWDLVQGGDQIQFSCGTNWLISGETHLTNAIFEPGAILTFEPGSSLYVHGPLVFPNSGSCGESSPIILTTTEGQQDLGNGPALHVRTEDLALAQSKLETLDGTQILADSFLQTIVSVTVLDPAATKGTADIAAFTISRVSGDWAESLKVNFVLGGGAVPGIDYQSISPSVTIAPNQGSTNVYVIPTSQAGTSYLASVSLKLQGDAAYMLGSQTYQVVAIRDPSFPVPPLLLNIDFDPQNYSPTSYKSGPAATGQTEIDFWNGLACSGQSRAAVTNLVAADFTQTAVGVIVSNTPGCWLLGSPDLMYDGYVYPNSGQNGTITLTNAPEGKYSVYLYGYDGNYDLAVGSTNYGNRRNRDWPLMSPLVWTNGRQYSLFTNLTVSAGQPLTVTLRPGTDGYAVVSGMQMALIPDPPTILTQPLSQTVTQGNAFSLSVAVAGTAPFLYQWKLNGTTISGATSSVCTKLNAQPLDGGIYTVTITNYAGGVVSSEATVTVMCPPSILTTPLNQTVVQGQDVSFNVLATGSLPVGYQWRFNGANIPGATATSYSRIVVSSNDAGNYSVLVTNSIGSTSATATLVVEVPLTITNQPTNLTRVLGENASFTVGVAGSVPAFQWYKDAAFLTNGSQISGTTAGLLTIFSVTPSNEANYSAVVTNLAGSLTSDAARLTVTMPPAVTSGLTDVTNVQGEDVTFSVGTTGEGLMYQWQFNSTNILGATKTNYTRLVLQTNDQGRYSVTVSNAAGATNLSANLTVWVPPIITQQPTSVTNYVGTNVTFSVGLVPACTNPLTNQWYFHNLYSTNALPGETGLSLNLTATTNGGYALALTNAAGTNLSATAWLSIRTANGTNYGWGTNNTPPGTVPGVVMISPTNTSPSNPAIYLWGDPISIRASATNQGGYITNVVFNAGTTNATNLLGTAVIGANTKYALAWTNAAPGTNWLWAVATDNKAVSNTSARVYVIMDKPPTNYAGTNQILVWTEEDTVNLHGWAKDEDGLPYGILTNLWEVVSGNGAYVRFGDRTATNTTATFSTNGSFVLQLTSSDGFASKTNTCTVRVGKRPHVSIAAPSTNDIFLIDTPIALNATAYDDDGKIASVQFYDACASGTNYLGAAMRSVGDTFAFRWTNAPLLTNMIMAVATDKDGLSMTSAPVSVLVLPSLYIWINSPANGHIFPTSPTNILLSATISCIGSSVSRVDFTNGFSYLGRADLQPNGAYQFLQQDVSNGVYTTIASATDNAGHHATNFVTFTVNAMPKVAIYFPTNSSATNFQSFVQNTNLTLHAVATDSDGSVLSVKFFYYSDQISGSVSNPTGTSDFYLTWSNMVPGTYPVTASATDDRGASSWSPVAVFKVKPTNTPPAVWITYPSNKDVFRAGADITITAAAATTMTNASITNVEFFVNGVLLGSDTNAPYGISECCWKPGTYTLVAKATDSLGASEVSSNVVITVATETAAGQGFWDQTFHISSMGEHPYRYPYVDECANNVYVTYQFSGTPASAVYGSQLYISSAEFSLTNGTDQRSAGIYRWNGTNWFRWGTPAGPCQDLPFAYEGMGGIAVDDFGVFVAGYATNDISGTNYFVKQLIGTNWMKLGEGFQTGIFPISDSRTQVREKPRLQFVGPDLYLFGNCVYGGNTNVQYLARWDTATSKWKAVGTLLNGPVFAIAQLKGNLVVGGLFTEAGGNANASYIAELRDGIWTSLGAGVGGTDYFLNSLEGTNAGVFSLAACEANLFAGGDFTWAGDKTNANGIAVWDGVRWSTIGSGLLTQPYSSNGFPRVNSYALTNPIVHSISPRGNSVYVAGVFTDALNADGERVPAASVAKALWSEDAQKWQWFSLDFGVFGFGSRTSDDYLVGDVLTTAILEGVSPAAYDLIVGGKFRGAGSLMLQSQNGFLNEAVARWRVGYPQQLSPPVVTITDPANLAFYTNLPGSIELTATATSSYTNIDSVEFFVDGASIGRGSDNGSGAWTAMWWWPPPTPGPHVLTANAIDGAGLLGQSSPVMINIGSQNTMTARDDFFVLMVGSPPTSLDVLNNDTTTISNPRRVLQVYRQFSQGAVGAAEVAYDGSAITYRPNPNTYGTDFFVYDVTDGISTNSAAVVVKVRAVPVVALEHPTNRMKAATSANVPVNGAAFGYDTPVTNLTILLNGGVWRQLTPATNNYLQHPTNFFFTFDPGAVSPQSTYCFFTNNWSANLPGYYTFEARVLDSYGYTNSSGLVTLILTNTSTATNQLTASIDNLSVTLTNIGGIYLTNYTVVRQGLYELKGQARDSNTDEPVAYQLLLHPPGDPDSVVANVTPTPHDVSGFHQGGDSSGSLGTNDFTGVPNGVYDLELIVRGGGSETNVTARFELDTQLKIGQFSFSEQDLVIPVSGIPLTVMRTYNSLNPNSADFGYSWTYSLMDMDVQLDEERTQVTIGTPEAPFAFPMEEDEHGLPLTTSIRTGGGWDVTLTLPDGRRMTFAFTPRSSLDRTFAYAEWKAPSDVHATLKSLDEPFADIALIPHIGPAWQAGAEGSTFVNHDVSGWVLQTQDGTKYFIRRGERNDILWDGSQNGQGHWIWVQTYGQPKLSEIVQRTGDSIVIQNDGIFHYAGTNGIPSTHLTRSVLFDRDSQGRIRAIWDPSSLSNGPAIYPSVRYIYHAQNGNLLQVLKLVDRTTGSYTTNRYYYDNPNFPHYITSIEDPRGVPVARNEYDDSGRLTAVVDADGRRTEFVHNTTNNVEIVTDRLTNKTSYVYDTQGNVTFITNALNQVTTATYDPVTNLKLAETNAYGTASATWTTNAYDENGFLTKTVDALHTNTFLYSSTGDLLSQADSMGNITSNLYDGLGNLTNSIQMDSQDHVLEQSFSIYDGSNLLVATLDANGRTNAGFAYDSTGNLCNSTDANGLTRSFTYDGNGNQIVSSYPWAGRTLGTYNLYDAAGRVVQTIDSDGNTNQTYYTSGGKVDYTIDKLGNTNRFFYDARGNLVQTVYPDGLYTRTVFDEAGRILLSTDRNPTNGTQYYYDPLGRATNTVRVYNVSISLAEVSPGIWQTAIALAGTPYATNSTVYDENGWVQSSTGPDRHTTTYTYYADGQLRSVTDPLFHTTFYAYDAAGHQQFVTNALHKVTEFKYDGLGRNIAVVYPDATSTSNVFNNVGQRVAQIDQAMLARNFSFDVAGQLLAVTNAAVLDPERNNAATNTVWQYHYDLYGRLFAITDAKGRNTTNFFDGLGRQTMRRLPLGQLETNVYDVKGRLLKKIDFKGQTNEFAYDRYGRIKAKFYFAAGSVWPSNAICYQYNNLGQLWKITERTGADCTTNACDGYAILVHPIGPLSTGGGLMAQLAKMPAEIAGGVSAVPLFLVAALLVPRRKWSELIYAVRMACQRREVETSARRRLHLPCLWWRNITLTVIAALLASDPSLQNLWTARADCANPPPYIGNETTRITEFTYDGDGHIQQVNSPEGVINYGYDLATGRHTSTCTPNTEVSFGYDELGRLQTVSVLKTNSVTLGTPLTTIYTYTDLGSRETVTFPNGIVSTNQYDALNRITNLTHKVGTTNLATYTYILHPTGRRTNAVEVLRQEDGTYITNTLTWAYDGMYRLTNETVASTCSALSYTNSYQYDLVGNRFTKVNCQGAITTITTNAYDANDELLTEVTKTNNTLMATNSYVYDANGSLAHKTNVVNGVTAVTSYAYDLKNKLSGVTASGLTTTFLYNDQGIRVRSTTSGNPNHFLIDANNPTGYAQVFEELNARGGPASTAYIIGDDVLGQMSGATAQFLLTDGHGSTRQLVSGPGGGLIVNRTWNYDAYGNSLAALSAPPETSHLYCGEQYDSHLQMYNLRARYYQSQIGRFGTMDSYDGDRTSPLSLHKYVYCSADPVNRGDAGGTADYTLITVLAAIAIGAILSMARLAVVSRGQATAMDYVKTGVVGGAIGAVGGFVFPIILEAGVAGKVMAVSFTGAAGFWQIGNDIRDHDRRALAFDATVTAASMMLPFFIEDAAPIQRYRATHEEAVADFCRFIEQSGLRVRGTDVYVKVPNYAVGRRYDVIIENPRTPELCGIEIKSTLEEFNDSAGQQADADTYVNRFGAVAFGARAREAQVDGVRVHSAMRIYWRAD